MYLYNIKKSISIFIHKHVLKGAGFGRKNFSKKGTFLDEHQAQGISLLPKKPSVIPLLLSAEKPLKIAEK